LVRWIVLGLLCVAVSACGKGDSAPKDADKKSAHAAEEKGKHGAKDEHEKEQPQTVELTPEQMRDIKVTVLAKRPLTETVRVPAEVRFNERQRVVVAARASGRVERVAVFSNQTVQKDELLAEVYSPEFLSAQQEYLLIAERAKRRQGDAAADSASLLAAATQRLRLLGVTQGQVGTLAKTGTIYPLLPVHSPISGTVIEQSLVAGDAIEPGKGLYVIADLATVWADLALSEAQLSTVRSGQAVTLAVQSFADRKFRGQIISIESKVDETTRTIKARAQIDNAGRLLKPGMFAEAEVAVGKGNPVLAVPKAATVRNPDGDWAVFIEDEPNLFKPVEIKIVRTVGDFAVIEGIEPGTRVVTDGAFFLQSELGKSGFDAHAH
jgi:multidrug efflux pump subunit AcrA (membrane-fusion protein)